MNDTKAIHSIECPCCHGDGYLSVYQIDPVTGVTEPMGKQFCTHCSGMGWIMAEIAAERDECKNCGYPRSEHHYNGACYGLCGEFE
jgi:hypothetical protein